MARPVDLSYSAGRYNTEQRMQVTGDDVSLAGTQASATELYRTTALKAIRLLANANADILTGGTAAGPAFTVNTSLAGTGALVPIGTATFGTHADSTVLDVTITETEISEGDDIVLESVAGTAASTVVFVYNQNYVEDFVAG